MMILKKILIAFGFTSILFGCYKEENRSQLQLSNYLASNYSIYRIQTSSETLYYFDSYSLISFLSAYGNSSPNVFDYNSSGLVDSYDYASSLSGFGNYYTPNYDLYSATIDFQASSGWQIQLSSWPISFIKVTPWDEYPPGNFIPDTIKSFVLEGINENGQSIKIWYYKK
jgi:hypothetical protein